MTNRLCHISVSSGSGSSHELSLLPSAGCGPTTIPRRQGPADPHDKANAGAACGSSHDVLRRAFYGQGSRKKAHLASTTRKLRQVVDTCNFSLRCP
jgi:hypothetical protein